MIFRLIEHKDLYKLVEIACTTFIETYAEQNDPAEFYQYVEVTFAPKQLEKELNTEGAVFYFLEFENETIGYFKINLNKSPNKADRPRFFMDFTPLKDIQMAELERIYLKKDYHGKGIASSMMAFIEDCVRQHNQKYLWLGVWTLNPKAIRYYEKCGFTAFGEHIFQIGNDSQKDFLMWKKI